MLKQLKTWKESGGADMGEPLIIMWGCVKRKHERDQVRGQTVLARRSRKILANLRQSGDVLKNGPRYESVDGFIPERQAAQIADNVRRYVIEQIDSNDPLIYTVIAGSDIDDELFVRLYEPQNGGPIVERKRRREHCNAHRVVGLPKGLLEPVLDAVKFVGRIGNLDEVNFSVPDGILCGA